MTSAQSRPTRELATQLLSGVGAVAACTLVPGALHSHLAALVSLAVATLGAALVWRVRALVPAGPLALATRVTLVRGVIAAWLVGLAAAPAEVVRAHAWPVIAAAVVELALDGLDGVLARRRREVSAFGGLLDGEIDALVVLALGLVTFRASGPDPLWPALAIGLMRHLFLAFAALWPRLRGQVPSSVFAKFVCDLQITTLLVCLAPLGPAVARWHAPLAWVALGLLTISFGRDVAYLLGRRR